MSEKVFPLEYNGDEDLPMLGDIFGNQQIDIQNIRVSDDLGHEGYFVFKILGKEYLTCAKKSRRKIEWMKLELEKALLGGPCVLRVFFRKSKGGGFNFDDVKLVRKVLTEQKGFRILGRQLTNG